MNTLKKYACHAVFAVPLALASSALHAQAAAGAAGTPAAKPEAAAPAAPSKHPAVVNFPSREDARKQWHANDPAPTSSTINPQEIRPAGTSDNRVSGAQLPHPNIDYAKEAANQILPIPAAKIREFRNDTYGKALEMAEIPGGPYESLPARIVKVSLDPGKPVEKVYIAMGKGAGITFMDRNGNPMVIDSVQGFSPGIDVEVTKTERTMNEGSNILSVNAKTIATQGRVMVILNGVTAPYIFDVEVGKRPQVDSSVSFAMPMLSKKNVVYGGQRGEADTGIDKPEMWNFLAGIPPEGAVEVELLAVPGSRAWVFGSNLYVRTPYNVMTPAYFDRRSSADGGATVYRLPLTPLIRLGVEGREVQVVVNYPYMPSANRASK